MSEKRPASGDPARDTESNNGPMPAAGYPNLTRDILLASLGGIALGAIINASGWQFGREVLAEGAFDIVGGLFTRGLQLSIIPVVLFSVIASVSDLDRPAAAGRIVAKSIGWFLATTAIAIGMALVVAVAVAPGSGFATPGTLAFEPPAARSLADVLVNLVPANPVAAMSQGNMLQVIVFAMLFGVAVASAGERAAQVRRLFRELNDVTMRLVGLVVRIAPAGVFALLAKSAATLEPGAFADLLAYVVTVLACLAAQTVIVYPLLIVAFVRASPMPFLKKIRAMAAVAFGTASSSASIPVTLRTVRDRLGVSEPVAAFVVPVGATINMDGAAIMQGVAAVFIANAYGIDLTAMQLVTLGLTAVLASIAAAGVPGAAIVLLATVLSQVGIPLEGIALVLAVDRLVDMARTAVNVIGDATVACIVARSEEQLDEAVYGDTRL